MVDPLGLRGVGRCRSPVGLVVSATVALPADIPGVALQAAPVYRLEVGGVIFVGLYVAGMSFVLALQNRAFTEFGYTGVKARSLRDLPEALLNQEQKLTVLSKFIDEVRDAGDGQGERNV